jgi:gamma-polyglutamate biosynthesis protein CapA
MQRILIFLLICFIALCAGFYLTFPQAEFSIGDFSWSEPVPEEEYVPEKDTIRFVGDVMLARNVENLMNAYGTSYPVAALPMHRDDAYLVGNFESAIPVEHIPTKSMTFTFSVKPDDLDALQEYGFTHFGLANNHAYDFGVDDFFNTQAKLQAAGFEIFGTPGSLSATTSITLLDVGSTTVALVGVYAVQAQPPLSEIASVFKHANTISDQQIAFVHWGDEYKSLHNASQERLAHAMVDAGADVVVGHHPHVIQDIELYKNAPIFYSLGNFIFDQYFSDEVQQGLVLDISYERKLSISLLPVTSIGSRSQPRLMSPYESDVLLSELSKVSDSELAEMIRKGLLELDI